MSKMYSSHTRDDILKTTEKYYEIILITGLVGLLLPCYVASKDVKFQLYTRSSPIKPYNLDDTLIGLKVGKPVVIVIHGFTGSGKTTSVRLIRDGYLYNQDVNVVIVDWAPLAKEPYQSATENAVVAADHVAKFIEEAIKIGFDRHKITVVGFSLGAQVAGLTANYMHNFTIHRIIALDAAKPVFDVLPNNDRLDASDADFVMSIHTSTNFLGMEIPIGHVDFYPNGGLSPQPACKDENLKMTCSHFMAPLYFVESLYDKDAFKATKCDSWHNFVNNTCDGNEQVVMGDATPSSARGVFYLRTNAEPPYGVQENYTAPLHKPVIFHEDQKYVDDDDDEDFQESTTKRTNTSRRGKHLPHSSAHRVHSLAYLNVCIVFLLNYIVLCIMTNFK